MPQTHVSSNKTKPNKVKHIIAVGSGKGGVGKSTTAVNLALALQQQQQQVGLLDADIFGPNLPTMLGIKQKPDLKDNQFQPLCAYKIEMMSMGLLIDDDTPMIWRGPMVTKALMEILFQTAWSELDYLIIDLPPGTGDVQLTLMKKVILAGAVIVTTPQDVATFDARKGLEMFLKMQTPVLGLVENMSTYQCSQCDHQEAIFGDGGAKRLASSCQVPIIGQLPLASCIREGADQGKPIVIHNPSHAASQEYHRIAQKLIQTIQSNQQSAFPQIVVESSKGETDGN